MAGHIESERDSLLQNRQSHRKFLCCCSCKFSSKGALLVLVWQFAVVSNVSFKLNHKDQAPGWLHYISHALALLAMVVAAVISGWLADVWFGRSRVVQTGLFLSWIGMNLKVFVDILMVYYDSTYITIFYLIAVCIANIGSATFLTNSIQLCLEQMPDASSDAITAFLSWYVAVTLAGFLSNKILISSFKCLQLYTNIQWLDTDILFPLLSIAMCSKFLFRHWLIDHRQNHNPLRTVYQVLKFAKQHKFPIQRSAFTYCEDEIPSRIDLGKTKYGGPFTTEEVEDVKTFFRIIAVLGVLCAFLIAYVPLIVYQLPYKNLSSCWYNVGSRTSFLITAAAVLAHEYIVNPIIRKKCNFTTLKKIGCCLLFSLLCAALLLIFTILKDARIFDFIDFFNSHPWWGMITTWTVFGPISVWLTSTFQFICSQAPENIKGFILSITLSTFSIVSINSFIVSTNSYLKGKCLNSKHCLVYVMSAFTLLSAVLFIVYCCVARWYKRRERDEPCNQRAIIEEIYGRHVEHNSIEECYSN